MQLRRLICLALLRRALPEETCAAESSCKDFDASGAWEPADRVETTQPQEAGLVTLQVASDGIRWQIGHVLPERRTRDLQRSTERLAEGTVSPMRMFDTELLVVLRGLHGRTRGARASLLPEAPAGVEDLGFLEDPSLPRATALSRLTGQGALAIGHRAGLASIWRYRAQSTPAWSLSSKVKVSHHDWESVTLTVLSDDGRLLLAASEDNVMLFHLQAEAEPKELFHLHGGATQVSAACIQRLSGDGPRYLLALAMQRGGLQGWMVDRSGARETWKIPRDSTPVISRLDLAQTSEAPTTLLLAAGDGSGVVTVWSFDLNGALASPSVGRWSKVPGRRAMPISGIQLLHIKPAMVGILRYGVMAPQWLLSVSTEKDVYILDAMTGSIMHQVEGLRTDVWALSWR